MKICQSSNSVCDNLEYTKIFTWLGVSEYGEMGSKNELTTYKIKDKVLQIPHGYSCRWNVKCKPFPVECKIPHGYSCRWNVKCKPFSVDCKTTVTNAIPIFPCHSPTNVFSSHCPSTYTTNVLKELNCIGKMTWSGYKFFGFYHSDVERKLSLKESTTNENMTAEMSDLYNIQKRQGGPTSSLKYKQTNGQAKPKNQ